jgi:CotS family spore coat protein
MRCEKFSVYGIHPLMRMVLSPGNFNVVNLEPMTICRFQSYNIKNVTIQAYRIQESGDRIQKVLNWCGEILTEINHWYSIGATKIKPYGPIWKVYSSSGLFAFKLTKQTPEQVRQLAQVIRDCHKAGFPNLTPIIATRSGEPYALIFNNHYLLSPWLEGQNPDFTNRGDLQMVAKLLGRFHRILELVTQPQYQFNGSIRDELTEKVSFLRNLVNRLNGTGELNRIDHAILKWSNHFILQAELCIGKLTELEAIQRVIRPLPSGFCHNDPSSRNIIIQNGQLFLIDFELAAPGFFGKELAKFIVRGLQATRWDYNLIDLLLEAYATERTLFSLEARFLPYLCAFPQSFWRLCSQRFQEQLPWTETRFQKRLWNITSAEPDRLKCLRNIISSEF